MTIIAQDRRGLTMGYEWGVIDCDLEAHRSNWQHIELLEAYADAEQRGVESDVLTNLGQRILTASQRHAEMTCAFSNKTGVPWVSKINQWNCENELRLWYIRHRPEWLGGDEPAMTHFEYAMGGA